MSWTNNTSQQSWIGTAGGSAASVPNNTVTTTITNGTTANTSTTQVNVVPIPMPTSSGYPFNVTTRVFPASGDVYPLLTSPTLPAGTYKLSFFYTCYANGAGWANNDMVMFFVTGTTDGQYTTAQGIVRPAYGLDVTMSASTAQATGAYTFIFQLAVPQTFQLNSYFVGTGYTANTHACGVAQAYYQKIG